MHGFDQSWASFEAGLVKNVDGRLEIHLREQSAPLFWGHVIEEFDRVGGMQGGELGRRWGLSDSHSGSLYKC